MLELIGKNPDGPERVIRRGLLLGLVSMFGLSAGALEAQPTISCPTVFEVDTRTNVASAMNLTSGASCAITISGSKTLDIAVKIDGGAGKTLTVTHMGVGTLLTPQTWPVPAGATATHVLRWQGRIQRDPAYLNLEVDGVKATVSILPTVAAERPPVAGLGGGQVRLQGQFLNDSVGVRIGSAGTRTGTGAITKAACERHRVAFTGPTGSSVVPDTVSAFWWQPDTTKPGNCLALTRWKLPDNLGEHHLRARLVGASGGRSETFISAIARRKAYLISGLVGVLNGRDFVGVKTTADTVTVATEVPDGAGGKTTTTRTDIMKGEPTRDSVSVGAEFDPVLGVSFPLFEKLTRVRFWAAISLEDIDSEFYFGVSVLPLVFDFSAERSIVDVLFGGRLVIRDLERTEGCKGGASLCTRRAVLVDGPVFGVVVGGHPGLANNQNAVGI